MHARELRRPPLPERLTPAERDFYVELRRLVGTAGYSLRTLEDVTSGPQSFFSKSQWGRWLNGQSLPPRRAVRKLADLLAADDIGAGHLIDLWGCAFVPDTGQETMRKDEAGRRGRIWQSARTGRDTPAATPDQAITRYFAASTAGVAVPGLLPRDVPGFTGRERELARLACLAANGTAVVAVIDGTAGVGKTALAVHGAYHLLPGFPDGHLYADLRGYAEGQAPAGPDEVLEVFLQRLGIPAGEIPAGPDERSGLFRQVLATRRVLILLDNAAAESQVRLLLPGAGSSLVLITSRVTLAGLDADDRIDLDVLPVDDASSLVARLIGQQRALSEPEALRQVVSWCGGLPLALRIAGQILDSHPAWTVARLAEMLGDERQRLDRLTIGDRQVRAAFTVSYQHLAEPDARMFRALGLHPGPHFDVTSAARLAGMGHDEAEPILNRMTNAHLVTEYAAGRFAMHDLLRLFARQTCQETDDLAAQNAARMRLVHHMAELAGLLDACLDPPQESPADPAPAMPAPDLPSARQALARFEEERPNLLAAVRMASDRGWNDMVLALSGSMAGPLAVLRRFDDLLGVRRAALAAAQSTSDPAVILRALGELGTAYGQMQRREEAIQYCREALVIARESGDRSGECLLLGKLGLVHLELKQLGVAVGYHHEALSIARETGDRGAEARNLNNLGIIYRELGRVEDAITSHREALAIRRRRHERRPEGMVLSNLGYAHYVLRQFEVAVGCYQQALVRLRETGDQYQEARTLDRLACAQEQLRQHDRAAECWQAAAAVMYEVGEDEQAARLRQLAADAQSRPRRGRPGKPRESTFWSERAHAALVQHNCGAALDVVQPGDGR